MNELLDGWKMSRQKDGEIMSDWLIGWKARQQDSSIDGRMGEWLSGWMGGYGWKVGKWMTGGLNEQTDKQLNGWQKSWKTNRGRLRIIPADEIFLYRNQQ